MHLDAPAANVHLTYAREFTTAAGPADPVAAPEAVEVVVDLADSSLYLCQRRHASFSVVPAGGESPDHVYYQLQPTVNGVFWGLLTYAPNEITPWDWTFAPGSGPWCATATAVSLIDHSGASTEEVCVTEEDYESLLGDEENLCTGDEVAVPDSPPGETTDDIPYIAMPDTGCGGASDSGVPPAPWLLMLIALLVVRRPTASKEWRLPGSRQRRSSPSAA